MVICHQLAAADGVLKMKILAYCLFRFFVDGLFAVSKPLGLLFNFSRSSNKAGWLAYRAIRKRRIL
jgi:hypothetical protein